MPSSVIRLGILGLDTSHVGAFTKIFHSADATDELARVRVVAGLPAGNPEFPLSRDRVEGFTRELREMGVSIVDSLSELLDLADVIMLASVDGGQHLQQARPVFAAGKPVFIDKPLAASLPDALEIYELGKRHNVPWFSSSTSRFTPGYMPLKNDPIRVGRVLGCDVYSQNRSAPWHPDLFWYSIHGVELLYTIMGQGCESVSMIQTPLSESVRGIWSDGRVGVYRSIREQTGKIGVGVTVFGEQGIVHHNQFYDYMPMCRELAKFFATLTLPVPNEETIEIITFMTAATESKLQGGAQIQLAETTARARLELARRG